MGDKPRLHPALRRSLTVLLAPVIAGTLISQLPMSPASAAEWTPPVPTDVKGVAVKPVVAAVVRPDYTAQDRELTDADLPDDLPSDDTATVSLTGGPAATGARNSGAVPAGRARAGNLPIYLSTVPAAARIAGADAGTTAVTKVKVRLQAPTASVNGPVVQLSRADGSRSAGQTAVTVDYRAFRSLYGGDWASRLQMVDLRTGQPVPSVNDAAAGTLSATATLSAGSAMSSFAVAAAPEGDNGDFKATSLTPASSWNVAQQSGSFAWSYPIDVPTSVPGPAPNLALSYSSGAIDGRASGTNTQGSWVGDGWEMWPGYIERSYRTCDDDHDTDEKKDPNNADTNSGDLCYVTDNATMAGGIGAGDLVRDGGSDSDTTIAYKSAKDNGSRIELIKGFYDNDDVDKEYWRLTAPNGTQYFYGRGTGEGGSSSGTETKSVWTVPVYSNHPDEPGHATKFTESRHQRAYRWNLDHVVDPAGNTLTYYYGKEAGAYSREADADKRTTYDRGGYLIRAEYGSRRTDATTVRPAAQVLFDTEERCVAASCFNDKDEPRTGKYPDTPWDQFCKKAPCTRLMSPTFWTAKRLAKITTQVYSGSGTAYTNVDSWTLKQTYLNAGVNEGRPMWLKSVTHAGLVTNSGGDVVNDPPVVFNPTAEYTPNRVNTNDGHSSLFRNRLSTITTESGAQIGITYSTPECKAGSLPDQWSNSQACYPQYYGAAGEKPTLNWFHKYRVLRLDVYDNTGGFEHQQTNYDYLDKPAWGYVANEAAVPKKRTWSGYRGYGRVVVRQGSEDGVQSKVEYRYFRGMDGDPQPKDKELPPIGTPRKAVVTDSFNDTLPDSRQFEGVVREQITYNGVGGEWINGTLNYPQRVGPTATHRKMEAWRSFLETTRTRTKLSDGQTRWTKSVTTVNADNLPTQVDDLGVENDPADDKCVRSEYARNGTAWIVDKVKRIETVSVKCATAPKRPQNVVSDTRTYFDDPETYGQTPSVGLPVRADELDSYLAGIPRFVTVTRNTYDARGRVTKKTDALGRSTKTEYTPKIAGPVTSTVTTNAVNETTTLAMNTALEKPTRTIDINGGITDMTYDGSGRLLKVWGPGRSKTKYPASPTVSNDYKIRQDKPSYVITKTLVPVKDGDTRTQVTLFDGLLRSRETQTQTVAGGRAITETVYDSRGKVAWTSAPYYDISNAKPDTNLVSPNGRPEIPTITQNHYDGAGRLTDAVSLFAGDETRRTRTIYAGEKTSVIPPNGGVATTSVVDGQGRQIELRQYKDPTKVGQDTRTLYDRAKYSYDPAGRLTQVLDPSDNVWSYDYDLRGRKILDKDPDKGRSDSAYDAVGQLIWTKDARGSEIAYAYDDLGRKTAEHRGADAEGPKLAEWTYDTLANGKGRLTQSTRYEYDAAGKATAYITAVSGYTVDGKPTGTTVTVPASEGGLCASGGADACTYQTDLQYHPGGGALFRVLYPQTAGLPAETLLLNYNSVGLPTGVVGSMQPKSQIYAQSVVYNQLDQLIGKNLGDHGQRTGIAYGLDEHTGKLNDFFAIPELKTDIYNLHYDYNDAGLITGLTDTAQGQTPETQCFTYDHQQRLTEAWTPQSTCEPAARDATTLAGPAPYWRSYAYDAVGNRTTETDNTGVKVTRTSAYPAAAGAEGSKPHAVTSVTDTAGNVQQYKYDAAGHTLCRPAATAANTCAADGLTGDAQAQLLTWNGNGQLATSTDKAGKTEYIYDADGNRLIRRDPNGSTLYLPNGQEIRKPKTGAATGTRYYTHAGATIAVRTPAGVTWMLNDHNGTGNATISNDGKLTVTRRRTLPFGEDRGTAPTVWAGDKGFVGGTRDNTGLTHLGAREYDPALGRFISVDPVMPLQDPRQWNPYSYANGSPLSFSDPSGLTLGSADCATGGGVACTGNEGGSSGGGKSDGDSGGDSDGDSGGSSGDGGYTWTFDYAPPCTSANCGRLPPLPVVRPVPWSIKYYQSARNQAYKVYFLDKRSRDAQDIFSAPVSPGNGLILLRFFISDKVAATKPVELAGDDRGPTSAVDAKFRMAVAWDTERGTASFTLTQSCGKGWTDCARQGEISERGANRYKILANEPDHLAVNYSGINSKLFCCSINGQVSVKLGKNGDAQVRLQGDKYPDFEAYQYDSLGGARQLATDNRDLNVLDSMPFRSNRDITWNNGIRQ